MERWFKNLKNERVFHRHYQTRDGAKADFFDYIEVFYNQKRRHSELGYVIPSEVYSSWLAQQKLAACALRSYPLNAVILAMMQIGGFVQVPEIFCAILQNEN